MVQSPKNLYQMRWVKIADTIIYSLPTAPAASRILNLKFSCEIKHHSKIARTLVARHIKNVWRKLFCAQFCLHVQSILSSSSSILACRTYPPSTVLYVECRIKNVDATNRFYRNVYGLRWYHKVQTRTCTRIILFQCYRPITPDRLQTTIFWSLLLSMFPVAHVGIRTVRATIDDIQKCSAFKQKEIRIHSTFKHWH